MIEKLVMIRTIGLFLGAYYPGVLAFFSFLYSVSLWFSGQQLEGIFVGIWVPSILGFSVAIKICQSEFMKYLNSKE